MKLLTYFLTGMIFATGLVISEMTNTKKVLGFLDIFGKWDPSLFFVMLGAISVNAFFYILLKNTNRPLLSPIWHLPNKTKIDRPLVVGASLFGAGWGLGGICPGPAIATITALRSPEIIIFTFSMLCGMILFHFINKQFKLK